MLPVVWKVKDKTNKPIWITEGEKKCLKLIQHGRYSIALAGVWNFRCSNLGDTDLFSELKSFDWRSRTVYLAFDNDLWTNPSVRAALYELAFKVYELGAIVKIAKWESGKGIDDHLTQQNNPEKALQTIENTATELLNFLNSDHRHEIIRGLRLVENSIEKDILTKAAAKSIGIPVDIIRQETSTESEDTEKDAVFPTVEPWPEPVDCYRLLNEIVSVVNKYCVLPTYGAESIALWVLHSYCLDAFFVTPTLTLQSAEMRSGKTTTLAVIGRISHRPLLASNISPAAVFRAVEKWKPTLVIDEADSFIKDNEELRGILNSGHTRDTAFVIRTVGDTHEPMQFSTWAAKVIALIGKLPATLQDRSIILNMFRKKADEKVQKLQLPLGAEFTDIRRKCLRWANDNLGSLKKSNSVIPRGLHDRAADNWTPLFLISDLAGDNWPDIARKAAVTLSGEIGNEDTTGTMLLADIKNYFIEYDVEKVTSADLCDYLHKKIDRPWPEWYHGKPITPRQVARLLNPFGIIPVTIRTRSDTAKGYKKEDFLDAFVRYTPDLSVTTSQASIHAGLRDFSSVTLKNDVTDKNNSKSSIYAGCDVVTDEKGGEEGIIEMELNL